MMGSQAEIPNKNLDMFNDVLLEKNIRHYISNILIHNTRNATGRIEDLNGKVPELNLAIEKILQQGDSKVFELFMKYLTLLCEFG